MKAIRPSQPFTSYMQIKEKKLQAIGT